MTRIGTLFRASALGVVIVCFAPTPAASQQVVYVSRHAEQAEGVDDPPLTEKGWQRARALAEFLGDAGITAIYTSEAQRTRQTAEPLARALGIEAQRVPRNDTNTLIALIRKNASEGRVLVVGHSQTVPIILSGLGHPGSIEIDREDYDNLFLVVPSGSRSVVVRQRFYPPSPQDIFAVGMVEPSAPTPNISTEELRTLLATGGAVVLDTRPHMEWAVSHIPGALNVAPKPGVSMAAYTADVAEVERLLEGERSRPLVLYCNGPFCGKSKRVAADLIDAGYTDVRRYQLGAPVWRALGGLMVIEIDGARYVFGHDRTAVWIDARAREAFRAGSVPGARNLPRSLVLPGKDVGEVKTAKNDGRLPMEDHNTRIIVFGDDTEQVRAVAEALAREAFHNVTYFDGDFETLLAALP